MTGKALWHTSSGEIELISEELPKPAKDEVLIKAKYSFVSQGTESLVNAGQVPSELEDKMKVPYMKGSFKMPCTYGYSLVGEVIEGPPELIGKHGHVMHPHQDLCLVKTDHIFFLENQTDLRLATLISNTETAVNGYWDGDPKPGTKVLIVGFGSVGALTALTLSSQMDLDIVVHDLSEERRATAMRLGYSLLAEEKDFDLVYHTSATSEGLQLAIDRGGFESKIVDLSWYGIKRVSLHLGTTFHYQRKQLISSQVSHIPGPMKDKWTYASRKEFCLEILKTFPEIDFKETTFDGLNGRFESLRSSHPFSILKY